MAHQVGGRGTKAVERLPDRPEKRLSDHREAQSEEQRTVADAKPLPPPTMTRLPPFPPATQIATFPACTAPAAVRVRPTEFCFWSTQLVHCRRRRRPRPLSQFLRPSAGPPLPVPLASYPPHSHRCPRHLALCPPPPLHRPSDARAATAGNRGQEAFDRLTDGRRPRGMLLPDSGGEPWR